MNKIPVIIAAIPMATSFCDDISNNYFNPYVLRCGKKNYTGSYIYDDGLFNIATDPEIPIKGYMILAINKETLTIVDLTEEEREKRDRSAS